MIQLTRAKENPILIPTAFAWENLSVFNPGVIRYKNQIRLLYRALGKQDQISRIGTAKSTDGIHFTRDPYAIYYGGEHPSDILGIEDIRAVQMGDTYYLVYTAVSPRRMGNPNPEWKNDGGKKPQIALSTTKNFHEFLDYDVIIPDIEGKDASLFPKKSTTDEYWLLFRAGEGQTFFANSPHLTYWPERYPVFDKRPGYWDSEKVGIGTPPIETEKGWLVFYHGIDKKNIYRLGIMFLDLADPRKVLYRSPFPIFEPEANYEKFGFVPNVVFTCGAIEKDATYYIYYGAADETIGLATIEKKLVMQLF